MRTAAKLSRVSCEPPHWFSAPSLWLWVGVCLLSICSEHNLTWPRGIFTCDSSTNNGVLYDACHIWDHVFILRSLTLTSGLETCVRPLSTLLLIPIHTKIIFIRDAEIFENCYWNKILKNGEEEWKQHECFRPFAFFPCYCSLRMMCAIFQKSPSIWHVVLVFRSLHKTLFAKEVLNINGK